jgi:carbon-monoxide dehydrogenase medium subunit
MRSFAYHKPTAVADVVKLLSSLEESQPLSGGMTLLPTMKQRLAAPQALIDLSAVPGLAGIRVGAGAVEIGAMTRHATVAASAEVAAAIPALAYLASEIGDPAVRHRGTIGGSVANNDPAADYPSAVLGLAATVVTDRREIAADDFFVGMFQTALEPGEIITAVRFPVPEAAGYAKFKSPASRYALTGVFVAKTATGVRAAVTGAAPKVFRSKEVEAALAGRFDPSALDKISIDPSGLNSDLHAEREYRAHLVVAMARRAVARAVGGR